MADISDKIGIYKSSQPVSNSGIDCALNYLKNIYKTAIDVILETKIWTNNSGSYKNK